MLQPSTKENGELKYDMRIIAQNVEYYILMRDQQNFNILSQKSPVLANSMEEMGISIYHQNDLRDSLWYFDGVDIRVWTDGQELLAATPSDLGRDLPDPVTIPVDFYPLSVLLSKGILFGIEPDVMQRRDTSFVVLRFVTRVRIQLVSLFLELILFRQNFSFLKYSDTIYLYITRLRRSTLRITTGNLNILHILSKSCCMTFSTRKSTHRQPPSNLFCQRL